MNACNPTVTVTDTRSLPGFRKLSEGSVISPTPGIRCAMLLGVKCQLRVRGLLLAQWRRAVDISYDPKSKYRNWSCAWCHKPSSAEFPFRRGGHRNHEVLLPKSV